MDLKRSLKSNYSVLIMMVRKVAQIRMTQDRILMASPVDLELQLIRLTKVLMRIKVTVNNP